MYLCEDITSHAYFVFIFATERHIRHVSIVSFRKVMNYENMEREMWMFEWTSDNNANPEKESFKKTEKLCFEKMKFYQQKV